MTAAEILTHFRQLGIAVETTDGRLKVSAPKGAMTESLREHIRANRDELLALLQAGSRNAPLAPISRDGPLPLSRFQRRLWIVSQLRGPNDAAYGLATVWPIGETDDVERLTAAIRDLVRRHEILRTIYPEADGEPVARILQEDCVTVERLEFGGGDETACRKKLEEIQAAMIAMPFDLEREPSFRWKTVSCAGRLYVIVSSHHIGVDQWSFVLLRKELRRSLTAVADGKNLAPAPLQYVDFADWQRRREDQAASAASLDWWAKKLADLPDLCVFPPDLAEGGQQAWDVLGFEWDEAVSGRLRQLAHEHRVTPYMALLAVCAVALCLHTGQTDIVIGSPTGSRERTELETMIGPFVNVLTLRLDLDDDPSFATLLGRARETMLDAHAHADAPFESIVERLNPSRSFDHMPLFQVAVVQHNATDTPSADIAGGGAMYDLTWYARDIGDRMGLALEYRSDLYSRECIAGIASHFEAVLRGACLDPTKPVSRIPLAGEDEVLRQISALQPPAITTLAQPLPLAFEQQARKTPSRIAVSHDGATVSYADLSDMVDRVARLLAAKGVRPRDRVGVCMDRTPLMLAALLGIQRLGAAYVPLDPGFPDQRLTFMVRDSDVRIVLADASTSARARSLGGGVLFLDDTALREASGPDLPCQAEPGEAAYVIYTSGSTGQPNGVVVPHGALSNFLDSMLREPGLSQNDVVPAITTISFDIAALELFAPLLVGATIELISRDTASDGAALLQQLSRCEPTLLQATPATWRMLLDAGWRGGTIVKALCGGENLPVDLATALLQRVPELWNMYGPTETTVWSTAGRIREGGPVHIGKPIANTQVYIVNEHGALVPPGIAGEIVIGGAGLALGYHIRDELTARRFVENRISPASGARLYRTGDLGMWSGGKLRHLGRLDHQIKIRGYRIEAGEIETALMSHPAVRRAVVIPDGKGAATRLVAYCTLHDGAGLLASEARAHLRTTLPDYMIPSLVEFLDAIPLTPNGKVDRKSLPSPTSARTARGAELVACEPGLETEIGEIWKEVLSIDQVGADDNFFEIGGHSLLSLQVTKAVKLRTGYRLEPRMLFSQSLRSIASALKRQGGDGKPA